MLYTIYPYESVFPQDFDEHPFVEMQVQGRLCLGRRGSDGITRLERLMSTDPADYLDPRFTPRTVLSM